MRLRGWKPTGSSGFGTPPKADALTGGTPYPSFTPSITPLPAAPKPAAPAPQPTASKPVSSSFKDAQWNQDTAGIVTGAGQTAAEFGASAPNVSYDANGNPRINGGLQIDWANPGALNPFSKAALLVKSFQEAGKGTSNSYASRGQHNSGAYGRAQGANEFGFAQGRSGIDSALRNFVTGANQNLGQASINAITRQEQRPQAVLPGSAVPATGTATYGNVGANGAPSANDVLKAYGQRPDANGNAPSGINGTVKLANGWTMVYVNGKPKFIPPGGRA